MQVVKVDGDYHLDEEIGDVGGKWFLWHATVPLSSLLGYPLSGLRRGVKRRSAVGLALDLKSGQIKYSKQVESNNINKKAS